MRILLTAAAAITLTAALAAAQYKKTPQPPPPPASQTQTSPIQITMPNSSTMAVPVADEDLAKARRISRAEAMKMVKARKAVYVDVRSKETYDESHIPGAISIPLSQLPARFKDLPPKKFLITYCA